jgi:hypothetical protein
MSEELIDVDQFAEGDRVPEVLRRLARVQEAAEVQPLGLRDGLACFNYLYRVVTEQVQRDYEDGQFSDGDFITRLDVAFANRYLAAIDAKLDQSPAPWRCLLELRSDRRISPLAFAVVGVSAHVNFDLAFAVVETGIQMGRLSLIDHDDYQHLNAIFFREMRRLRQHFEDTEERRFERSLGLTTLENLFGDAVVVIARYLAWERAKRLFGVRHSAGADARAETASARSVGGFNHMMLVFDRTVRYPASVLVRLGRRP